MKILVVEHHLESGRILQKLVEHRGHEEVTVGSAEEAEVELANQSFRFLILDWRLAENGFRAALSKPFTRHELANVLQRTLEIPSRPPLEIGSRRSGLAFADFIELTEKSSDVALISSLVPPERISVTIQHNEGGEPFYAELTG